MWGKQVKSGNRTFRPILLWGGGFPFFRQCFINVDLGTQQTLITENPLLNVIGTHSKCISIVNLYTYFKKLSQLFLHFIVPI